MTTHALPTTPTTATPVLLRRALQLDAVVTGANGVVYLAAAGALAGGLGLSTGGLRAIGAFLLVFAAAVWAASRAERIPARPVAAIVLVNVVWAVDSLAVLALGWLEPTTLGGIWIAMQALTVGGFAALQEAGRRQAS